MNSSISPARASVLSSCQGISSPSRWGMGGLASTGGIGSGRLQAPVHRLHLVGQAVAAIGARTQLDGGGEDRKSTRLNSSHVAISYAVFCLKKKNKTEDG